MSLVHRSAPATSKTGPKILYDNAVSLFGHKGPVYSAKFGPSGRAIASAGHDRQILLWHLPTDVNEELPNYGVLSGHRNAVTSLLWQLETSIFSVSADSTVAFWDAQTGQRLRKGIGHSLAINDCAASKDGVCVSVGDDGSARVWDEREKAAVAVIKTGYPLLACDIAQDGTTVFVGGIDPVVGAYDIGERKMAWNCGGNTDSVCSVALSADDSMLVTKAMDGLVRTLSARSMVPAGVPRMSRDSYEGVDGGQMLSRARFSPDDIYIGLGSTDGTAVTWASASHRMTGKYSGHTGAVLDVDFNPGLLMSSSMDGSVIVREITH